MKILRLLWLDIQKMRSIRQMDVSTAVLALLAFNGWFTSTAFLVYTFMVIYGIFSYDDTSIAENFYGVLPVRREQVVKARYLFAFVTTLLMALLMLLVNSACALLFNWPLLSEDFLFALLLGLICGVIFICVAFPLTMHMGAQKSNMYVLITFILAFIFMSYYGGNLREGIMAGAVGLLIFCLLALLASCQVCLRLYRKREFYDYVPMKEVRRAKAK